MTRATKLNYVTCEWGVPGDHWAAKKHTGVDFRAPVGTPVFCTFPGRVIYEGEGGGGGLAYGKHIIIQSKYKGRTYRHLYAHLDKSWVNEFQQIKAGDEIGISGKSGNVTAPHLHYEERVAPFGYWNFIRPVLLYWRPLNPFLRRKITRNIDKNG